MKHPRLSISSKSPMHILFGLVLGGYMAVAPAARADEPRPAPPSADAAPAPTSEAPETANGASTPTPDAGTAEQRLEQARDLFWKAHERYDVEDYDAATELFEQSYALFPQPEVLFNIALARARSGRCDDARQAFERYQSEVSADTVRAGEKFESLLTECRNRETTRADPSTPTAVESPEQEPKTQPAPAVAPAPRASANTTLPRQAVTPSLEPDYWTTQRVVGWSLLGVAVVATGTAIYFDDRYRDGRAREEKLQAENPQTAGDESAELQDRDLRAQIGRGVATGVALGAAVVGAGLIIYGSDAPATQVGVSLTGGLRLGVTGHF